MSLITIIYQALIFSASFFAIVLFLSYSAFLLRKRKILEQPTKQNRNTKRQTEREKIVTIHKNSLQTSRKIIKPKQSLPRQTKIRPKRYEVLNTRTNYTRDFEPETRYYENEELYFENKIPNGNQSSTEPYYQY